MHKNIWDKLWKDKHEKRCSDCDSLFFKNIVDQFRNANMEGKTLYVLYNTDNSEPYWITKCGEVTGYNSDQSINVNVIQSPRPDGSYLLVEIRDIIRHPSNIYKTFII